jgi:dihydrodipicolinate synthase/N-acetylneuraminate lyase
LYVATWNAWKAGNRAKAMDMFSKVMLLVTEISVYGMPAIKYLLELRGVFENHICRSGSNSKTFDAEAQASLKATMDFVRPHFRT